MITWQDCVIKALRIFSRLIIAMSAGAAAVIAIVAGVYSVLFVARNFHPEIVLAFTLLGVFGFVTVEVFLWGEEK
jgi:mannitol-specific phosphotransferase system IIBC component